MSNLLLISRKMLVLFAAVCSFSGVLLSCATVKLVDVSLTVADDQQRVVENNALIIPGSTLTLTDILVTDSAGVRRKLSDEERFTLTVTGGLYDPASRKITLSSDPAEIPSSGYKIIGLVGDGPAETMRLEPDFAGLFGPEPESVASVTARLEWIANGEIYEITQGTALIPGETYRLRVTVRDKNGRTFERGVDTTQLPKERITISLINFSVEGEDSTKLIADNLDNGAFAVQVGYAGNAEQTATLSFPFDEEIANGPNAQNIRSIEVFGELGSTSLISPGNRVPLQVRVKDIVGRVWVMNGDSGPSHVKNIFKLPASNILVATENATYMESEGEVWFDPNAQKMIGQQYGLTVSYASATEIGDTRAFRPDFLDIVPLMDQDELVYRGQSGRAGRSGQDGQDGTRGNSTTREMGRGGDGRSGGNGTNGQIGARGAPGSNLRIVAREVRTLDASTRLALLEVRAPGQAPEYFIRKIGEAPLTIVSQGGEGGSGGDGGHGGTGGDGGNGYFSGDGGDGGDAGGGGDGGDGGNGGSVSLILASFDMESIFVLDSHGGSGGRGGNAGVAGQPGIPGSIDDWAGEKIFGNQIPPEVGAYGSEGNIGRPGRDGFEGLAGSVEYNVDESQAAALVRRVPDEIRSVILF